MSKKNRKQGWLFGDRSEPEPQKHKAYTADGNEIHGWEDEVWGDWDRKPDKREKKIDWDGYKQTGVWKGYGQYKPTTLTYSYVEQMANMIASQHNINIKVGNGWGVDLDGRVLTYNPVSLMYMSKSELLATLLHEVGKIAMCDSAKKISNGYVDKYHAAYKVVSVFDDFRVDDRMIKSYPSAPEIYESLDGILEKVVKTYRQRGTDSSQRISYEVRNILGAVNKIILDRGMSFEDAYMCITKAFPVFKTMDEFKAWVSYFTGMDIPTVWDYCAAVIDKGYGVNSQRFSADIDARFERTKPMVVESTRRANTQDLADAMDTLVFPFIEDLMKNERDGGDELRKGVGDKAAADIQRTASREGAYGSKAAKVDFEGNSSPINGRGRGTENVPHERKEGDYSALRESVDSEIRSLTRKMSNLRRVEQTARHRPNERRGRLNMKQLYKHPLGNRRLFRRKVEATDTLNSFTFSIMVDTSGSMHGNRIIHTVRALILLSEVFGKLDMRFEVMTFEDEAKVYKTFDGEYSKDVKTGVAAIVRRNGGGTALESALKKTKITQRPEFNRVVVILTDGQTENHEYLNRRYFEKWEKGGIRSIVIGLETTKEMIEGLNGGKGMAVENAAEMPQVFYDILKKLIFKKK